MADEYRHTTAVSREKQSSTLSSFPSPETQEDTASVPKGEVEHAGTALSQVPFSTAPDAAENPSKTILHKEPADLPPADVPPADLPPSVLPSAKFKPNTVNTSEAVPDLDVGPKNETRASSSYSFVEEKHEGENTATAESAEYGAVLGTTASPEDDRTPKAEDRHEAPLDDAAIARLAGDIELKADGVPTGDESTRDDFTGEPFMPLVLPTQTYAPRAPSLSLKHSSKPSSSSASGLSRFNNTGSRRSTLVTSRTTPSSPRKTRSPSVASSDASSVCSNHSAIIEIPEPGARASVKSKHSRNPSDPRYIRFLSAVSENQKKADPQRYIGYPGLVSHMTETQSLIFRRFDEVHVRMLLYLQDQIAQLEARLLKVDEQNEAVNGIHNGTFRYDPDPYRLEIMESLRVLLGEYDIMILTFSKMQDVKASDKTVSRLKDWLKRYSTGSPVRPRFSVGGPIAKNELEWLDKAGDLSNLAVGPGPTSATRPLSMSANRKGSISAAKAGSFIAAARAGSISTTARVGSIAAVREGSFSSARPESVSTSRAGSISAISPTSTGPLAETWNLDTSSARMPNKQSTFSRLLHSRRRKESAAGV